VPSNLDRKSIADHVILDQNWKILDEVIAISKEINRTPAQVIKISVYLFIYLYIHKWNFFHSIIM
jgi:hypothetical protein